MKALALILATTLSLPAVADELVVSYMNGETTVYNGSIVDIFDAPLGDTTMILFDGEPEGSYPNDSIMSSSFDERRYLWRVDGAQGEFADYAICTMQTHRDNAAGIDAAVFLDCIPRGN